MATEEEIKITPTLADLIVKLLDSKLNDNKRRAYPMPDIFQSLEKEIKEVYPDTDRYKFQKALSVATKAGQLKGYEIKLGKHGGIGKIDYKKPGTPEPVAPVIITVPAEQESSTLEFDGKSYRVSFSKERLEKLLTKVFRVQENLDGSLVFDDRRFATEEPGVREYIDNFLFYFNESDDETDECQGEDHG